MSGDRSKNGRFSVVEFGGDIYVTDLMKGTSRRLTRTNAREHDPVFATDANRVFFLRDDNVYAIDLDGGLIEQLTDIRPGPEPSDSAKATGQRGRLEQQQRDLFEVIRDRVRADSIRKAEQKETESRGLKTFGFNLFAGEGFTQNRLADFVVLEESGGMALAFANAAF